MQPGASFRVGRCTLTLLGIEERQVPTSMEDHFGRLVGVGGRMGDLFALLSRVVSVDIDVLVTGETGTGTELVAHSIRAASSRKDGPLVVFDATNINRDLAESELFGHRRGAFTGAVEDRVGLFQAAHGDGLDALQVWLELRGEFGLDPAGPDCCTFMGSAVESSYRSGPDRFKISGASALAAVPFVE